MAKPKPHKIEPFEVMAEVCNECLLSKNMIVDDARRDEILEHCNEGFGSYFVCHKSSMNGGRACCRAFFDGNLSAPVRLAKFLAAQSAECLIQFVDEQGAIVPPNRHLDTGTMPSTLG